MGKAWRGPLPFLQAAGCPAPVRAPCPSGWRGRRESAQTPGRGADAPRSRSRSQPSWAHTRPPRGGPCPALPPPTGHTLSARNRNEKAITRQAGSLCRSGKETPQRPRRPLRPHSARLCCCRYLTRLPCASSSRGASPTASALLWASSCLLSLASPSAALICRLGGPRRKCLGGFWAETRRDKSHS